jgi:(2Fe-2S) ferredoxin
MEPTQYRAYICCGPNCGPKGSPALIAELERELERQQLGDVVSVMPTGCHSHCDSGPTIVVYPGPVYYQEMNAEKLGRLVAEHFGKGTPVRDFLWQGIQWRGAAPRDESRTPRTSRLAPPSQKASSTSAPNRKPPKPRRTYEVDDFKW